MYWSVVIQSDGLKNDQIHSPVTTVLIEYNLNIHERRHLMAKHIQPGEKVPLKLTASQQELILNEVS